LLLFLQLVVLLADIAFLDNVLDVRSAIERKLEESGNPLLNSATAWAHIAFILKKYEKISSRSNAIMKISLLPHY
jgi:hypothetical protein